MKVRSLRSALLAAVSVASVSTAAHAIEVVVVTAEKRTENIQTVPIAVSAFSADQLKGRQIRDVNDLQLASPSLLVSTGQGDTLGGLVRIRGVGTTGNNAGLEASVGVFVDGVYRNRSSTALEDLVDVERVEVLRGPQGTLFGKNTTAGVISIISRKPSDTPEFFADVSGGSLGSYSIDAYGSGGIADGLSVSLAGTYRHQDGFLHDVNLNISDNAKRHISLRGQALWEPTSDVSVRFIADYSQKNDSSSSAPFVKYSGRTRDLQDVVQSGLSANFGKVFQTPVTIGRTSPFLPLQDANYKRYKIAENFPRVSDVHDFGFSGQLDWTVNDHTTLSWIAGYRNFASRDSVDNDYTPASLIFTRNGKSFNREFTQELQFKGSNHQFDWLLGVFFSDEQIRVVGPLNWGSDAALALSHFLTPGNPVGSPSTDTAKCILGQANANPVCAADGRGGATLDRLYESGDGYVDHFSQNGQSISVFTHDTWHINDEWSVTGGLRFNHENKHGRYDGGVITWHDPNALLAACGTNLPAQSSTTVTTSNNYFAPFNLLCARRPYDKGIGEDSLTGTGVISWKPTDKLFFYGSYSRGYKAAPFNLDRNWLPFGAPKCGGVGQPACFTPDKKYETSDNFELGARSEFWDGRAIVDLTLFAERFKNFQINTFNGVAFAVANEPHVFADGFELESTFEPIDGLDVNAAATYAYSKYGRDVPTPGFPSGSPTPLAGKQLTQAPAWTLNGAWHYETPLAALDGMAGFVGMNANFRTKYNTGSDLNANKIQPAFVLVNAEFGLRTTDAKWELRAWGRNIFNEHYNVVAFNTPFEQSSPADSNTSAISVFPGEPAIYGATLSARY